MSQRSHIAQQRQHRDERVLGGVQRAQELRHRRRSRRASCVRRREPDRLASRTSLGGRSSGDECRSSPASETASLVGDHLLGDRDLAERSSTPATRLVRGAARSIVGRRLASSPACTSRRGTAARAPARGREVELGDEERLAEVKVDGALVDGRVRALPLDRAEHRAAARVDDRERVGSTSAARRGRRGSRGPPRRSRRRCRASSGRQPQRARAPRRRGRRGRRRRAAPRTPRSARGRRGSRGLAWSRIAASTRPAEQRRRARA